MTKLWINIAYIILFFLLTVAVYLTFTFANCSFVNDTFSRILLIAICYLYFYKLKGHLNTQSKVTKKHKRAIKFKKKRWKFSAFSLGLLHFFLVYFATYNLNNYLIESDSKQTIATIKDCSKSRGTEYCVYSYTIDNQYYEIEYCREPYDTTTVIYYSKLPVISRLKNELE